MTHEELQHCWREMQPWLSRSRNAKTCPFVFPELQQVTKMLELPPAPSPKTGGQAADLTLVSPSLNCANFEVLFALQLLLRQKPDAPLVSEWAEKLLRVCEVRRRELKKRSRLAGQSREEGKLRLLWACLFLLEYGLVKEDARFVNLVLKVLDQKWVGTKSVMASWPNPCGVDGWTRTLLVLLCALVEYTLCKWSLPEFRCAVETSSDERLGPLANLPMKPLFDPKRSPSVIVFSPSVYSLYTLTTLELLRRHGIGVDGIAIRKFINVKRLIDEGRRDGSRLVRKIYRELLLRGKSHAKRSYSTLGDLASELGVNGKSVVAWAKEHDVPVWKCRTLNDVSIREQLESCRPALVLFTGGGLIRQETLDRSGAGVVNCHMGLLPRYRGMDVAEWPILEGRTDRTGVTVHFMVEKIDEGDILAMHPAPREHTETTGQLRQRMSLLESQAIVSACIKYLQGKLVGLPQELPHGKQYFIMHPRLLALTNVKYARFCGDHETQAITHQNQSGYFSA